MAFSDRIPLSILTGFLGSGKTTLLNRLLSDRAMAETAVLVNELGEVGIDHLIVEAVDEEVVLLESGCVCCSVRDDFTLALLDLYSRRESGSIPKFKQVMLETTGIAEPASILQLMMADQAVCQRFQHGPVITVVDACYGPRTLAEIPEAVGQVVMADRLVIAKTDLVQGADLEPLEAQLRSLNASAPIFASNVVASRELLTGNMETSLAAMLSGAKGVDSPPPSLFAGPPHGRHADRYSSFHLGWAQPVPWAEIEAWLEGLLFARGDDIFRLKGVLNLEDEKQPAVIQSVQHSLYARTSLPRWPMGVPRSDLIFITRNFSRQAALASLAPFVAVDAR